MTYKQARTKLMIEYILMLPFVLAGKFFGLLFPFKTKHTIFLFFPNADIGGTPQVNADITKCIAAEKPIVIFSKKPANNQFRELYNLPGIRILDLYRRIDNKLYHFVNFFYRGVLASRINQSKNAIVFGGESLFFYKIVPHLQRDVRCIELSNVNKWLPYNIGFAKRLNVRICSSMALLRDVKQQYRQNHFDPPLYEHLQFIDNSIDIPPEYDTMNEKLEVVFIGRGSPQKRVHLIAEIAKQLHEEKIPVHFSFVGDVETIIGINNYPYCKFYGSIKDPLLMKGIYRQSDVLILTSAFEGLPLVVMQMMAQGRAVVSTAVNAIPDYIYHNENGLLITEKDETLIVEQGKQYIAMLAKDRNLLKKLSSNSRGRAMELFNKEAFCKKYKRIFEVR